MRDPLGVFLFVGAMALATLLTRFAPFLLPAKWTANRFVGAAKVLLPGMILLLLVVYSLKDVRFAVPPYGLAEAAALAIVVGVHLWRRNALLSISLGTGLYMLLVQTGALKVLL